MSLAGLLGVKEPPKLKTDDGEAKRPAISPFDFVLAIQQTDEDLIVDDWSEKQYNAYIVNRALSMGADTTIAANEMNCRAHLGKKMQFDFLRAFVRKRKRYNKWMKAEVDENMALVREYFNCNNRKARTALSILTPDNLDYMREKLNKGGA